MEDCVRKKGEHTLWNSRVQQYYRCEERICSLLFSCQLPTSEKTNIICGTSYIIIIIVVVFTFPEKSKKKIQIVRTIY